MASLAGDGDGAALPLSIDPPSHVADAAASAEEQQAVVDMEAVEEAEASKGTKRDRHDPDPDPEEAHQDAKESAGADEEQEPVSKKARGEAADNGNAGIYSVEVRSTCAKVSDEHETEKGTEAEAEDPVDGNNEVEESAEQPEGKDVEPVQLGPKVFHSGAEMFTYFYDLLHGWVLDYNVNMYEKLVLSDLILKGHLDADTKIGPGIQAFQVKNNPKWRSRCFYIVRSDGSLEDFSYRKCVDKLMPLPPELFLPSGSLNLDSLLSRGKDNQKVNDEPKSKDGQVGSRGFHGGRGGRRGGHRGRGRFHRRH